MVDQKFSNRRNPRSDCNKHIIKREHYTRKNNQWKPKRKFNNKEEAEDWINKYKMIGYKAYRCRVCGYYHIGKQKCEI